MSDPYDMPTCSTCGDVVGFCSCIEKVQDERNSKLRDGKQCPECHDKGSIVEIAYGYPGIEMIEKYEKGEIKLGGCLVSEDNPDWHCNKCGHEWSGAIYGRML